MRVEQSMSLPQIARELGVSTTTVMNDLDALFQLKDGEVERHRKTEVYRQCSIVDELLAKWVPFAMSNDIVVGETKVDRKGKPYDITIPQYESAGTATDKVIKLLERKAKILGLDANIKPITPEEVGNVARGVIEIMSHIASKPIQAEVIDIEPPKLNERSES